MSSVVRFKDKRAVNEKHPLYAVWKYMIKTHTAKKMVCERWLDFWNFVEDVGEKPNNENDKVYFHRHYFDKPYGPGNWRWRTFPKNDETRKKKALYARLYRKTRPEINKNQLLKKCYGITLDDYNRMLKAQNGVCAICEGTEKSTCEKNGKVRTLNVDHCHTTGLIRGLLCSRCNRALGFFGDSVVALKSAIKYLGG